MRSESFIPILILLVLILGCGNGPRSEEDATAKCTTTLENAPPLRNFKLGMTVNEIQKKFPDFKTMEADEVGLSEGYLFNRIFQKISLANPKGASIDPRKFPEFEDLLFVKLEILDSRIISIKSGYATAVNDTELTDEELRKRVAESLNLPVSGFVEDIRSMHPVDSILVCEGFSVSIGREGWRIPDNLLPKFLYYFVLIEDEASFNVLEEKRVQKKKDKSDQENKRRQEDANKFKP